MVGGLIRHRGLIVALVVLVAGGIAVTTLDLVQLPTTLSLSPSASNAPGYQGGAPGEPEATAAYIKGMQLYDASMIWGTYSDQHKIAIQRSGGSVADTQAQLDQNKRAGSQIASAQYIGSYLIPNGSMHFYAATMSSRRGNDYQYYVFRLDSHDKIVDVQ